MKRFVLIAALLLPVVFTSCKKVDPLVKNNNHEVIHPMPVDLNIKVDGYLVKWGNFNLGAVEEAEYGNYYAWGETQTKMEGYNWNTYKYADPLGLKFTKYCKSVQEDWWGGKNDPDGRKTLVSTDDPAAKILQGGWRMPTIEEVEALLYTQMLPDYEWEYDELTDVKNVYGDKIAGFRVTYKPWNTSVFFPLGGRIVDKSPENVNILGYYWTSSLSTGEDDGPDGAFCLGLDTYEETAGEWTIGRYYGALIRPVYVTPIE
ncbi:MAG: hypothetical protein J6X25_02385 [Bacteroidales bacterium]|nr:hypothetical protein [Bacteroidales bacterium]